MCYSRAMFGSLRLTLFSAGLVSLLLGGRRLVRVPATRVVEQLEPHILLSRCHPAATSIRSSLNRETIGRSGVRASEDQLSIAHVAPTTGANQAHMAHPDGRADHMPFAIAGQPNASRLPRNKDMRRVFSPPACPFSEFFPLPRIPGEGTGVGV